MKKILICTTILTTVKAFLIPNILMLQKMGYEVDLAGSKDTGELDEIVRNIYDIPFHRNPFSKLNLNASKKLNEIVNDNHYDAIHFHTPVASAFGRWAVKSKRANGTKILYTAHGFHFFKGAPFLNWMIYYPIEKLLSKYTDVIVTINKEDYSRAKNNFNANQVEYIPGVGIDVKKFIDNKSNKMSKRIELGVPKKAFLLLSVGEINKNKNHEVIIRALSKLNNKKIFYIICGKGPKADYLNNLAIDLGVKDQFKLLGFREDIWEICNASDAFMFPSLREGLGVAALEAMACGLPIITSNVHGIMDYSIDGITGFSCDSHDIESFAKSIKLLMENESLRNRMSINNIQSVNKYDLTKIESQLFKIYKYVGL